MTKYHPTILLLIFSTILLAQEDKYELLTALKLGHPNAVEAINRLCIN